MKELIAKYFNYLRLLSDVNSKTNREFVHKKLEDHRQYMSGLKRYSPYIHDEWEPS